MKKLIISTLAVFDSLNYNWTLFLLNYDLQAQLDILKNIQLSGFFIFFVLFLAIFLIFYVVKNKKNEARPKHKLQNLYFRIENWAVEQKVPVQTNSTPVEILNEVRKRFPEMKAFFDKFVPAYIDTVYRENGKLISDKELKKEWNQLIKQKR